MLIRTATEDDRPWLRSRIEASWGLPVVTPAGVHDAPERLDGLIAEDAGARVGAVTWTTADDAWEVVTLEAVRRGAGIGRALLTALRERAAAAGARRVWLITTDDNPDGVAFYAAIAMERVRSIPRFSDHVARFKPPVDDVTYDAIEFEWRLDPR